MQRQSTKYKDTGPVFILPNATIAPTHLKNYLQYYQLPLDNYNWCLTLRYVSSKKLVIAYHEVNIQH